ncbi:MAG: methyltransferase domain-containing protein [Thermoleophilaceae bacterium]
MADAYYERRFGTVTRGIVEADELGIAAEGRQGYGPSGWRTLRRVLPRSAVSPSDVFVDIGSGMGRVLLQAAALYRMRRVIGVELAEELNDVARANIERNRRRLRTPDVEIVTADATSYEIPDDVTIVFMHNPFGGDLFAAVADNIIASVDANPRDLRLIYEHPREHDALVSTGRFQTVSEDSRFWRRPGPEGDGLVRTYAVMSRARASA